MIGPLLFVLSWGLLRLEHKPISVLGFDRPGRRTAELLIGLLLAALFVAVQMIATAYAGDFVWTLNPDLTGFQVLDALRFTVNSVLFEELSFRGYLLFQAIRLLGPRRACFLSAASFGTYHWFSYGVIGNPVAMTYVFLLTGGAGLMFAFSFLRTGSLALPIGLHLGWNLLTLVVFSGGPIGDQVLVPVPPESVQLPFSASTLLIQFVWPLCLTALVLWKLPSPPASAVKQRESRA